MDINNINSDTSISSSTYAPSTTSQPQAAEQEISQDTAEQDNNTTPANTNIDIIA